MERSVPASSEQVMTNNVKKRPKNIILLSDGTGNSARKLFKTNVWRLYQALDLSEACSTESNGCKQIAHYNDGVGTSSFKPLAIIGGAFGYGTKRIVIELYKFLCRHYEKVEHIEERDNIYAFGFSRGAFAIRMLVGLLANRGLVKAKTEADLNKLAEYEFRMYRQNQYPRQLLRPFRFIRSKIIDRKLPSHGRIKADDLKIHFLGLWDTVAAYGLPIDELTRAYDFIFPLSFPDRNLSKIVDCAYHALAIDDERLTFHPELWNEKEVDYKKDYEKNNELKPLKDRLTQVWFSGMHSNIGGGYPDDGMSSVPLNWILNKAVDEGLRLLPNEGARLREASCISGRIYDSRRGLSGVYRYAPRNIHELTHYNEGKKNGKKEKQEIEKPRKNRIVIDKPKIHISVLQRINGNVEGYAPIGLPKDCQVVGSNNEILELSGMPNGLIGNVNQVEDRMNRQEKLWDLVWWKRIVYFMSIIVFILLAAFPFLPPRFYENLPDTGTRWLYPLSTAISKLGEILPNVFGKWLRSYQSHPGFFILTVAVFAVILWVGSRLQHTIFNSMRIIFDKPLTGTTPAAKPTGFVHWLRTDPNVKEAFRVWRENVVPFLILVIVALLIVRGILAIDIQGLFSASSK